MAFVSMATIKVTDTASLLHNNLAASPGGVFAGLHNSANTGGGKIFIHHGESRSGPEVTQGTSIRFLSPAQGNVLCVSSTGGTQIYSEDALTLLSFAPVSASVDSLTAHHRGACVVASLQHIAIGTSAGGILLVNAATPGHYSPLTECHPSSAAADVADICFSAASGHVVTAHDDGDLHVWLPDANGAYADITTVPSVGEAPVRIAAMSTRLLVAYAAGHIRLFDAMSFELQAEITAHARCLTAVDVKEDTCQVASVGEDTVLNVWIVDPGEVPQVSLQYSSIVIPKLLTGVMLTSASSAVVTAYDSDELYKIDF